MMRVTVIGNPNDPSEFVREYREAFDAVGFEVERGHNDVRVTPADGTLTRAYDRSLYHVTGVSKEDST